MLCMKIANNSPLFPDFRFQIYYSKFICYRCQDMSQKSYNFPSIMKTLWNKRVSSKLNVKFDLLKQKRNMENKYLTTGITYDWGAQIQCSRDFGPSFRITIGKYQGSAAEWNDDNNFIGSPSPGQCSPPAQSPENIVIVCLCWRLKTLSLKSLSLALVWTQTSRSGSLSALARKEPKRCEVAAETWVGRTLQLIINN